MVINNMEEVHEKILILEAQLAELQEAHNKLVADYEVFKGATVKYVKDMAEAEAEE